LGQPREDGESIPLRFRAERQIFGHVRSGRAQGVEEPIEFGLFERTGGVPQYLQLGEAFSTIAPELLE
jgi:hypothetical protein